MHFQLHNSAVEDRLRTRVAADGAALAPQGLKHLQGQVARSLVDSGHVLQRLDGLRVLAAIEEKLGRLPEVEDDEAQDEDAQRDGPEGEEEMSPARVGGAGAAVGARGDVATRGQRVGLGEVGRAGLVRNKGKGDDAADDDADGLEDGQAGEEEALVLRDELEGNGGVDGDVSAHAKANKGREDQEGGVTVGSTQAEPKDGGDEARQVEGPAAADDVGEEAPDKGTRRQTGVEARRDVARLVVAKAQLLLHGTEHQPKGLRPEQIQHVAKAAEPPDVPLVPAHALGIQLAVDQDALHLVQRQAFETRQIDRLRGGAAILVVDAAAIIVVVVDKNNLSRGGRLCRTKLCHFRHGATAKSRATRKKKEESRVNRVAFCYVYPWLGRNFCRGTKGYRTYRRAVQICCPPLPGRGKSRGRQGWGKLVFGGNKSCYDVLCRAVLSCLWCWGTSCLPGRLRQHES